MTVSVQTVLYIILGSLGVLLSSRAVAAQEQSGQLTAADIDDNLNFDAYIAYQDRTASNHYELPYPELRDRVSLSVVDSSGEPFSCAIVDVYGQSFHTGSNGKLSIWPYLDNLPTTNELLGMPNDFSVQAKAPNGTCPQECSTVSTTWTDNLQLEIPSLSTPPPQMDLALVIDTTGSMCDELSYLQAELAAVLNSVTTNAQDVRVAVVGYRDYGDEYITFNTGFNTSTNAIADLQSFECDGGGDYPEAMDEALETAQYELQWRSGNVARVLLLVADAPPHDQNLQRALTAALGLRRRGVKIYGLAASGVATTAEYLMRMMSLVTDARYLWLTDDSGIGNPHAEPKVLCYRVTQLEKLLVAVLSSELQGRRIELDPSDIIREVGQQEAGICIVDPQDQQGDPEGDLVTSPDGDSTADRPSDGDGPAEDLDEPAYDDGPAYVSASFSTSLKVRSKVGMIIVISLVLLW